MHKTDGRTLVLRVLLALLTLLWAGFIFLQSAKSAAVSDGDSLAVVGWIATLMPGVDGEAPEMVAALNHLVRKCAHFSEYAVLGLLCGGLFSTFCGRAPDGARRRMPRYAGAGYALGVCAVYACTDELHQAFVPGRAPGVIDVLIDSAGATAGILLVLLMTALVDRCRVKGAKSHVHA